VRFKLGDDIPWPDFTAIYEKMDERKRRVFYSRKSPKVLTLLRKGIILIKQLIGRTTPNGKD
jgi:hypothetical protein